MGYIFHPIFNSHKTRQISKRDDGELLNEFFSKYLEKCLLH